MVELAQASATSHRFAFGGVALELEVAPNVHWQLTPEFVRHVMAYAETAGASPVACTVRCCVELDRSLPSERIAGIQIRQDGAVTRIACDELRAEIRRDDEGRLLARARVAATSLGANAVVLGVSAAALQLAGGLHLHASGLELDGRALLFVGPSGAGKSTALGLTPGCSVLAYDRVALVRLTHGRYVAWSLPGGSPVPGRWCETRALPVAAILRVRQGNGSPALRMLGGARRLFALRESVDVADPSPAAEDARMVALERIAAELPVGELETVLATPHTALLRELLAGQRAGRSSREEAGLYARL